MRYRRSPTRYIGLVSRGGPHNAFDLLIGRPGFIVAPAVWRPPADISETEKEFMVVVELAGVAEENLEIVLHEDALVIEGERHPDGSPPDAVYHSVEIRQGRFRLELPLPVPVDGDEVDASLRDGILRLRLPKRSPTTIRPKVTPGGTEATE